MISHPSSLALALTLTASMLSAADIPDPKPLRVTGNSVQAYVDVAAAASCLKADAKELLKDYAPTFNTAGIEDIRPHRFTAIYDDGVRVYEYLALWVRTQPVSNGADPFAPKPAGENQKARLFLVIMVRVKSNMRSSSGGVSNITTVSIPGRSSRPPFWNSPAARTQSRPPTASAVNGPCCPRFPPCQLFRSKASLTPTPTG